MNTKTAWNIRGFGIVNDMNFNPSSKPFQIACILFVVLYYVIEMGYRYSKLRVLLFGTPVAADNLK